jgi:uncharacterized protein DUF4276
MLVKMCSSYDASHRFTVAIDGMVASRADRIAVLPLPPVNDNKETAPSKRILKMSPGYEKPLYGSLAASEIGLRIIRRECCLFNSWLSELEMLS